MRHISMLAVSTAAVLAAGTMVAQAAPHGGFGGGHFGGGGAHFAGGGFGHGGGFGRGGFGYGRGIGYGLAGAGVGYGLGYGYGGYGYGGYDYGDYAYGYGDQGYYGSGAYSDPSYAYDQPGYGVTYAPQYSAPLRTGRSAAYGSFGKYCSTPVKTCTLYEPSSVGAGCSCKVGGGRASGSVTP